MKTLRKNTRWLIVLLLLTLGCTTALASFDMPPTQLRVFVVQDEQEPHSLAILVPEDANMQGEEARSPIENLHVLGMTQEELDTLTGGGWIVGSVMEDIGQLFEPYRYTNTHPGVIRMLLLTSDGTRKVTPEAAGRDFTLDYEQATLRGLTLWDWTLGDLRGILERIALAVLIQLLVMVLFKIHQTRVVVLTNIAIQLLLNIMLIFVWHFTRDYAAFDAMSWILRLELFVVIGEYLIYSKFFTSETFTTKRLVIFSMVANLCSYIANSVLLLLQRGFY